MVGAGFAVPSDTTSTTQTSTTTTTELPITTPPHVDETKPEPTVVVHEEEEITYGENYVQGCAAMTSGYKKEFKFNSY